MKEILGKIYHEVKFMADFLRQKLSKKSAGGKGRKTGKSSSGGRLMGKQLIGGWAVFFYLISIGITLAFVAFGWLLVFWGLAILFLRKHWIEIEYPDVAAAYRFGKFLGILKPGPHVFVTGLHRIRRFGREEIVIALPHQTMYAKENNRPDDDTTIEIEAKVYATLQLGSTMSDLRKALDLPEDPKLQQTIFEKMTLNAARIVVGRFTVYELVSGKTDKGQDTTLAKNAHEHLEKDLSDKYGWHVISFGIEDFNDKVKSEEGRLKALAKGRGAEAKELGEALRNHPEAAGVMQEAIKWNAIAGSVEKVASVFSPKKRGGSKSEKEQSAANSAGNLLSALPKGLQKALNALGGEQ